MTRISRRSLLASAMVPLIGSTSAKATEGAPEPQPRIESQEIADGVWITDVRIVPGVEPVQYLIEVENHRPEPIDAPSIGAIIPSRPDPASFTWAQPWETVILSGKSTFGIGFFPDANIDLATLEWTNCGGEIGSGPRATELAQWHFTFDWTFEIESDHVATIASTTTNTGNGRLGLTNLMGVFRGPDGRIVGGAPVTNINGLGPGASVDRAIAIKDNWGHVVSPFHFVESVKDLSVEYRVMPAPRAASPGCPPVMPWNR